MQTSFRLAAYKITQRIRLNQHVSGQIKLLHQAADHLQTQGPYAVKDFRHAPSLADGWLKIFAGQAAALHHMLQKLYGVWIVNGKVCFLIVLRNHSSTLWSLKHSRRIIF